MIALVVSTKNEIRRVEYDPPHYDVIKEAVGGWYERVHPMGLNQPYSMMVNEEGLLLGLPITGSVRSSMAPPSMVSLLSGTSFSSRMATTEGSLIQSA